MRPGFAAQTHDFESRYLDGLAIRRMPGRRGPRTFVPVPRRKIPPGCPLSGDAWRAGTL